MPKQTKKIRCKTCRRSVLAEYIPGGGWKVRQHTIKPGQDAFGKPTPPEWCAGGGVVVP